MSGTGGGPIPLVDGFFNAQGEDGLPHLLVSRCRACGARAIPPRKRCAACSATDLEVADAPATGTIHTWTVVHELAGRRDFPPYIVAMIRLDHDLLVQGLVQADPGRLRAGLPVQTCLVSQGKDSDGREVVGYAFAPSEEVAP